MIRSPIICVLGHIDAGKTTLLDKIRKTAVAQKEAGGITQHIGATEVPTSTILEIAKPLLNIFKFELKIPGLLFIDTPGHEVFTNLRRRGSSVSDLAIIVVDVMEGFQVQTYEAIELCKQYKVPFLIALNKIDRIPGWKPQNDKPFLETIKYQDKRVLEFLEEKLYTVVGQLAELGFDSERFDRVKDFTRQVAIVPISAKTGEGIPELLLLVAGIAQKFLEKRLRINVEGPGRGIILEKKEVKGLGTAIDVILYDGKIKKGDLIAFLTKNGVKVTKIRGLFKPQPLREIREKGTKFVEVNEVTAAAGIRIAAEGLEEALPGSSIYVIEKEEDLEKIKVELKAEIEELIFETEKEGIVLKADTLGTLEAILRLLKNKGIPVAKADIGNIDKEDVMKCISIREKNPKYGVIVGFNVKIEESTEEIIKNKNIPIILDNVIYHLIEKIENYIKEIEEKGKRAILEELTPPAKIYIIPGCVFRKSKPAIVGIEVLAGKLRKGVYLMNQEGKVLGRVLSMQIEGRNIDEVKKGEKCAIAIDDVIVGRHIEEGEILYTYVSEDEYKKYKEHKDLLTEEEKQILREIAQIMRKQNPAWGL